MKLRILKYDDEVNAFAVKRVFMRRYANGVESLYYELPFDERGKGNEIYMDTLKEWEVFLDV